jgi:GABA(A) receptor-associated protein
MFKFKNTHTFDERSNESQRVIYKYPGRIPIICERHQNCRNAPIIDKTKYLVPNELTIGQFIYIIRKRMSMSSEKALFLFINGKIPSSSKILNNIYNEDKDKDGFLYINYTSENTFG